MKPGLAGRFLLAALFLLVPLCGAIAALIWPETATAGQHFLFDALDHAGVGGVVLATLAQVLIAASGILPASIVGIAAGALYGIAIGFPVAAASTLAGALLTFGLSRSVFRDAFARLLARRPRLKQFDTLVERDGWRLVCLLRVSPVMPFAATSYALGLSSVTLSAYVVGTLASLPALLGYVVLGRFAGAMTSAWRGGLGLAHGLLLAIGILATAWVTLRIGRLVRLAIAMPGDPALLD